MITEKRKTELKELFIEDADGNWKNSLTQEEKIVVLYLELAYYIGKQQVVNLILQNICNQLLMSKEQLAGIDFHQDLQTLGHQYVNELNSFSSIAVPINTDRFTQAEWEFYGLQAVYESFPISMVFSVYELMATIYGQEMIDQFQMMQHQKFSKTEVYEIL